LGRARWTLDGPRMPPNVAPDYCACNTPDEPPDCPPITSNDP
jgi:hypothetical protein